MRGETNPDDNSDQVILTTGPDLFVKKELADGYVGPGELITFTVTFGNGREGGEWWWGMQGEATLTDTLPAELEYITSTLKYCDEKDYCDFVPESTDGPLLVWPLWQLQAGEWNEIMLTVRVTETVGDKDSFTNTAEIRSSQPLTDIEPYDDNNIDSLELTIHLPVYEVGKVYETSSSSGPVAGTLVTYTLTVTNSGTGIGYTVSLSDTIPAGLTVINHDGSKPSSDTIVWNLGDIEPDGIKDGFFSADLSCKAGLTINNDDYLVAGDAQGITSDVGPPVTFDVIAPTIDLKAMASDTSVVVGDSIDFTAAGSTDGTSLSYKWDFDDGKTANGAKTSHAYSKDGTYQVSVTATDGCGFSKVTKLSVTVSEPNLNAVFTQSANKVIVGEAVSFTDKSTTDGPAIVKWEWDFGDGKSGTGKTIDHTYETAGAYQVRLTVTDALGYSETTTSTVDVEEGAHYIFLPILSKNSAD